LPKGIYVRKPRRTRSLEELFWSRVNKTDSCWLWTGSIRGKGYGQTLRSNGSRSYAHRFSYELVNGPIPEGLCVDHICRVRLCVNPAHLQAVTLKENLLRGISRSAANARKTLCVRGHPLSGPTMRITPRGTRECVICTGIRNAIASARRKHAATKGDSR
jgi:hypothetical protein